ncbi:hypothetical protein BSZ32_18075 [Rubritalea profundi]|uniref:Uncharacterized protein n=1 Tax=Rubritalea profundi TaxID=1658618 RepID=A0A2S7U6T8_9BACT|nr:hypothetical protein BSZ32_18075 [Rubritalea profundi]
MLWLDTALRQARLDARGRPATKKPPSSKATQPQPDSSSAPHASSHSIPKKLRRAAALQISSLHRTGTASAHFIYRDHAIYLDL